MDKRWWIRALVVVGLCLASRGTAWAQAGQAAADADGLPRHVALFGASSFSLANAPLVRAFRRAMPDATVTHHGRHGWNVRRWLRDDPEGEVAGADLVVVYLGPNAAVHRPAEVAELDRRLRSHGARVVWLRPPAFKDPELQRRSDSMWAALIASGVESIDARFDPDDDEMPDGLHVNRLGAPRWVSLVTPELIARHLVAPPLRG